MGKITLKKIKEKYGLTGWRYDYAKTFQDLSLLPLPEDLILEAADYLTLKKVTKYSKLSEGFIWKFRDKLNWYDVSQHQKLSEDFIEKVQDYVDWYLISVYQKLSENFIRKFKDKVDWVMVSKYQPLSEEFIYEFKNYVNWEFISRYQVVSRKFLAEFRRDLHNNSDKSAKYWKEKIQEIGLYECHDDFFYAYKAIRSDRYSYINFQYQYLLGKTYECFSDYSNDGCSFGLSIGTEIDAINYGIDCDDDYTYDGILVKVKVYYKDVTAVLSYSYGNRMRCKKLTVVEDYEIDNVLE